MRLSSKRRHLRHAPAVALRTECNLRAVGREGRIVVVGGVISETCKAAGLDVLNVDIQVVAALAIAGIGDQLSIGRDFPIGSVTGIESQTA